MKLRIRGDSIRLRLSKAEVVAIAEGRAVSDRVNFPGGGGLTYALLPEAAPGIRARFRGELIEVAVGVQLARDWAVSPEKISLEGSEPIDGGASLSVLVEKDFFCRSPRSRPEDESDLFPNPSHGCSG